MRPRALPHPKLPTPATPTAHPSRGPRPRLPTPASSRPGLDDDLACSAAKTVAEKIQKGFSAKFRKNKQADADEKEAMARDAFDAACSADSYQQYAQMGAEGKRKYGDFNAAMSKGGSMVRPAALPAPTSYLISRSLQFELTGAVFSAARRRTCRWGRR